MQPVFPFKLSDDWTVVTRTIVPFLGVPWADAKIGVTEAGDPYLKRWDQEQRVGIGDINPSAFFVPTMEGDFTFGFGPTVGIPVSDGPLGSGKWTAGPAVVGVYTKGPWVVGGLVNNMWSFAGDEDRADVYKMLIQPFVLQPAEGLVHLVSPIITADWENDTMAGPSLLARALDASSGLVSNRSTCRCMATTMPSSLRSGVKNCSETGPSAHRFNS